MSTDIHYFWNRDKQCIEIESVRGKKFLKWSFETRVGRIFLNYLFSTRVFSRLVYNSLADSSWSRRWITPFIQKNNILMEEFEIGNYANFNEFFIRKFKSGARSFVEDPRRLPAFAEGKYLGYESLSPNMEIPVKQMMLNIAEILGSVERSASFIDGPVLVCRLRPTDYHRFHYPDEGVLLERYRIHGSLHATNPVCYEFKKDVFHTNERQVSFLETKNFGLIAYVEVGAMNVGRIIQTHPRQSHSAGSHVSSKHRSISRYLRGQEKGYFLVGGSTVIVIGQKGRWKPLADILANTDRGMETHVKLGEPVAES